MWTMNTPELLDFVKAIADADRLRIIGLLAQKPARFSEIVNGMGFHPADAQRHLDQLIQNGIVQLADGIYDLNAAALEKLARSHLQGERRTFIPEPDLENDRRRILAAHLKPDGTIKAIPAQSFKLQVVLDYLINAFTIGANYSEKEVNMILAHFHPDTAALRRSLIDAGMLERERNGTRYWRPK
jgi:hypothetical protein